MDMRNLEHSLQLSFKSVCTRDNIVRAWDNEDVEVQREIIDSASCWLPYKYILKLTQEQLTRYMRARNINVEVPLVRLTFNNDGYFSGSADINAKLVPQLLHDARENNDMYPLCIMSDIIEDWTPFKNIIDDYVRTRSDVDIEDCVTMLGENVVRMLRVLDEDLYDNIDIDIQLLINKVNADDMNFIAEHFPLHIEDQNPYDVSRLDNFFIAERLGAEINTITDIDMNVDVQELRRVLDNNVAPSAVMSLLRQGAAADLVTLAARSLNGSIILTTPEDIELVTNSGNIEVTKRLNSDSARDVLIYAVSVANLETYNTVVSNYQLGRATDRSRQASRYVDITNIVRTYGLDGVLMTEFTFIRPEFIREMSDHDFEALAHFNYMQSLDYVLTYTPDRYKTITEYARLRHQVNDRTTIFIPTSLHIVVPSFYDVKIIKYITTVFPDYHLNYIVAQVINRCYGDVVIDILNERNINEFDMSLVKSNVSNVLDTMFHSAIWLPGRQEQNKQFIIELTRTALKLERLANIMYLKRWMPIDHVMLEIIDNTDMESAIKMLRVLETEYEIPFAVTEYMLREKGGQYYEQFINTTDIDGDVYQYIFEEY